MFKDRFDAALQLAKRLGKYRNKEGVVLAVPRGGVPLGYVIAKELGLPLELILSKKIGHPHNSEFAIGYVTLQGSAINSNTADIPADYIHRETNRILAELAGKQKMYTGNRKPVVLKNKTLIIVDDGAATGNTLIGTVTALKKSLPEKTVIAIPVAPPQTVSKLTKVADEVVCLETPEYFQAVGQAYENFDQVSDDQVMSYLKEIHNIDRAA